MNKILFVFIVFIVASCGGVKPTALSPSFENKDIVELNSEYTKEIGESVIENNSGYYYDAIEITKGTKLASYYSNEKIEPGFIYELKEHSDTHNFYFLNGVAMRKGLAIPKTAGEIQFFIETGYGLKLHPLKEQPEYNKRKTPEVSKDTFSRQLLYNGKAGNSIKFTYREYVNDMARPAFSQDLQYDLNESNIIGFKGMRVEVISAGNTSIKYKVLKGFE